MSATPCHFTGKYNPELWVSDSPKDRARAMTICRTECPAAAFAACARLALTEPFGVMAGVDHHDNDGRGGKGRPCAVCGVRNYSSNGHAPRTCEGCVETKTCQGCGTTITRYKGQSNPQWKAAKFCGRSCSAKRRVAA